MHKMISGALLLLVAGNASAGLKFYQAPQDWVRSTNSTAEVRRYVADVDAGKFSNRDAYSPEVLSAVNAYIAALTREVSPLFSTQDDTAFEGTVCKLSITTGNTSDKDTSPPEVLSLEDFADNKRQGCTALAGKVATSVNRSAALRYPALVKDNGLLSIDLIAVFNQ